MKNAKHGSMIFQRKVLQRSVPLPCNHNQTVSTFTMYSYGVTRVFKDDPGDTFAKDDYYRSADLFYIMGEIVLINWRWHFIKQIPPKVAARPAVQSARVSSIEVFIDEECAGYVIRQITWKSCTHRHEKLVGKGLYHALFFHNLACIYTRSHDLNLHGLDIS